MITAPTPLRPGSSMTRHEPAERFDVHQVEPFQTDVDRAPGDVIVDLGRTRFLDAAALHALVDARAALVDRNCELWIDGLSQTARITLELAGLAEAFPTLEHRDAHHHEAVAA